MKRTTTENTTPMISSNLITIDGYVVHLNNITKNIANTNHHYSFLVCLENQETIRIVKYLGKIASCSLHTRLKDSLRTGTGATITNLRQQMDQYSCTRSTKVVDKQLDFRPDCIRVTKINSLKHDANEKLCTVEAKVCDIGDEVTIMFEQNEFKRVQKMKKNITIADTSGSIQMTVWEPQFNHVTLSNSYHIRLLKLKIFNDEISLSATTDTTFIKIDNIENVLMKMENKINSTRTDTGQIISIQKVNNHYTCQGCGSENLTETATFIKCNECHSCLLNNMDTNDNYFKITIITSDRNEYNLKVSHSLIQSLLTKVNTCLNPNDDFTINEQHLNLIVSLNIEFNYTETTGFINDIQIINEDNTF